MHLSPHCRWVPLKKKPWGKLYKMHFTVQKCGPEIKSISEYSAIEQGYLTKRNFKKIQDSCFRPKCGSVDLIFVKFPVSIN